MTKISEGELEPDGRGVDNTTGGGTILLLCGFLVYVVMHNDVIKQTLVYSDIIS